MAHRLDGNSMALSALGVACLFTMQVASFWIEGWIKNLGANQRGILVSGLMRLTWDNHIASYQRPSSRPFRIRHWRPMLAAKH
jgi:hypothetical protein